MFKRMSIMLIVVGLILGGVFGFKLFQNAMIKKHMSSMSNQPQTVSTIVAKNEQWNTTIDAVGTLIAVNGVNVSSEVAGVVEAIYFTSGEKVEAGKLLVKLRCDDETAALASLQADVGIDTLTYKRDLKQLEQKSIAQATADIDNANLQKSKALVAEQKAKIEKKFIRAPFAGYLGLNEVDLGEYLSPGTVMVTLQSLDPIYFDFYLPQQQLDKIKLDQVVVVKNDLYPDRVFPGKILAISSKVDAATRNVKLRAILDNPDHILLPGMYARVTVDLGVPQRYITLPQTAITYNPYGNTVFTVKNNATAQQKFVTLGPTRGDQVAILSGVIEGETVVTSGQIKLQNGSSIIVNNTVLPSDDPDPKPTEN